MVILTYPMNCFLFLVTFCNEIDSIVARFWWGHNNSKRDIHWRNWGFVSFAKKKGGLGFRSLLDFNVTLLEKQFWHLISYPTSFWAHILRGRYFPNRDAFILLFGS